MDSLRAFPSHVQPDSFADDFLSLGIDLRIPASDDYVATADIPGAEWRPTDHDAPAGWPDDDAPDAEDWQGYADWSASLDRLAAPFDFDPNDELHNSAGGWGGFADEPEYPDAYPSYYGSKAFPDDLYFGL